MSTEHDTHHPGGEAETGGIHLEAAPFEPGYQPGSLPKISVPDLAADAEGLSAEALARVPTLTEQVAPVAEPPFTDEAEPDAVQPEVALDVQAPPVEALADQQPAAEIQAPAQDEAAQADTWTEVLHARMGKLNDDIHTLNARLDRLEERNKTKV